MKLSKKILAAVLAALMAISMMPITVFATTYDSSTVDIDNLREGDIITTSVNKIIGLAEFSLTLQAGGYGSNGGNAENTDLRISWPEFSNGSVVDDEVKYYPFDENGNQSDTWYVVALDHGWDTITLSGIAPAPLNATFTGNLVDTFETGIMNKFIGGDVLDYDTTPVQKDRAYEISRGVDDYGLIVVVSVPGNAAFDPADISFTIGETVSRPVSDDDNDDRSAAVWYYPPDENDDPKVYEFFVTKAAFTDSMVVDYTPSTPAPAQSVSYKAASVNATTHEVTFTDASCDDYTVVTASTTTFEDGKWYVV
ncbi:MAG: hypothetical protein IJ851_07205, partial [Eubacterium sp.]|nr:hypothetical protein [Eubacterium sp.]